MAEEYEPIIRQIRLLERRVVAREDTINYFLTILQIRREELRLPHEQLMAIDTAYRGTFYAIRALRGWQTRDRQRIEELRKHIPPIKALRLVLTFSIETGTGHEPFYAEVTCETVIAADLPLATQNEIIRRVMNATIKLFWIVFDAGKCVTKVKRDLWGAEVYDTLLKRMLFFQKYAELIYEVAMDNFIEALIKLKCFEERDVDEFVTRQAILKIGVEFQYALVTSEPKYPFVDVLIEKGKSASTKGEWVIEKGIEVAPKTEIDIMEILDMKVGE